MITRSEQEALATISERRPQHQAARDLVDVLNQLVHALHDEQAFNEDGANVHARFSDGPTRLYLGHTNPGEQTLRFVTQLIRDAIPGVIDAHLDAQEAKAAAEAGDGEGRS